MSSVYTHIISVVNTRVQSTIFPNRQVRLLDKDIPPENFSHVIKSYIDSSSATASFPDIREYCLSFKGAFRHIRGKALKHAILDNLKEVYLGDYDINKILQDAEEDVTHICK